MAKKVSTWFRIGVEGDTCDGRNIEATDIQQMGESFDPRVYGCRINLEHIRGLLPTGDFKRLGDVTEVKAELIDDDSALNGKWALFAKIAPTDELAAMVKAGQKIYTSMEIRPNFANTGKAYLVGLAVTDDPASLGTEMLEFSARAKVNPFAGKKDQPEDLFSVATLAVLEFEDVADAGPSFYSRVKQLLSRKQESDDGRFKDVHEAVEAVVEQIQTNQTELDTRFSTLSDGLTKRLDALEQTTAKGGEEFSALIGKLEKSQPETFTQRPLSNGGSNNQDDTVTDC